MPTSPVLSDANHRDAIERELRWLLEARPIWSSGMDSDCVPLIKICNGSVTEMWRIWQMNGLGMALRGVSGDDLRVY